MWLELSQHDGQPQCGQNGFQGTVQTPEKAFLSSGQHLKETEKKDKGEL